MKAHLNLLLVAVSIYSLFMLFGCSNQTSDKETLAIGDWIFELHLDETNRSVVLPFNVEVTGIDQLLVKNASEKIKVTEIYYHDDSVNFIMPVFGSEFKGKIIGNTIRGNWYKYNVSREYKIPFTAIHGSNTRFTTSSEFSSDFSGRWKSFFINNSDTSSALGIFGQAGSKVTGTFLTETGDYRYLEGIADGNRLKLSTFDGAHAFLFEASLNDKGELNGFFKSGNSWEAKWLATRDENIKLSDMKSLTYLKPGFEKLVLS